MTDLLTLTPAQVEAMTEADALDVLAAWVKAKRTELPEALAGSKSKAHARLAKKALYQLQSSGVEAKARPVEPVAITVQQKAPEAFSGVLSAILGTGERAIFFGQPRRGGGFDAYQGIISDELGILQINHTVSNRNAYRTHLKTLEKHPTLKVLLVPFERMKLELSYALAISERARHDVPEEAASILRSLQVSAVNPDWPVPLVTETDRQVAAGARALLKEPELEQWMPSEPAIVMLGQQIEAIEHSPLALTDAQKFEQAEQKAHAETDAYLIKPRREIYGRRLWAMAELLEASNRAPLAAIARAEARLLFHTTERSAFFEGMFSKIVAQRFDALKAK